MNTNLKITYSYSLFNRQILSHISIHRVNQSPELGEIVGEQQDFLYFVYRYKQKTESKRIRILKQIGQAGFDTGVINPRNTES